MRYTSTRDKSIDYSISEALIQGLAPDGGLFVPSIYPEYNFDEFNKIVDLKEIAYKFLSPYFDEDRLQIHLKEICNNTFDIDLPLKKLEDGTFILELFHGPTGAFKDFGARFLAQCFGKLDKKITILVATSGDTGSAVATAFHDIKSIKTVILYPKDKISKFQEIQLTCWGSNITSLRIDGDFDSCQKLVKEAFSNQKLANQYNLTSANSINIGRLLPQCVYYVYSSIKFYKENNHRASFIIPTGNMGNAMAAIMVKEMGFPIDQIILSCNKNDVITKYFQNGEYHPKPSIHTLANAMDVGNPSNLERFIDLKKNLNKSFNYISAFSIFDDEIKQTIRKRYHKFGEVWCPHTATAFMVKSRLKENTWIITATAHPAKFKDIVDPLVDDIISYPENLEVFLSKETIYIDMKPNITELENKLSLIYE